MTKFDIDPISFTAVTGWRAYYQNDDRALTWSPIVGVALDGRGTLHFVDTDTLGDLEYVDDVGNLAFITHESRVVVAEAQWRDKQQRASK